MAPTYTTASATTTTTRRTPAVIAGTSANSAALTRATGCRRRLRHTPPTSFPARRNSRTRHTNTAQRNHPPPQRLARQPAANRVGLLAQRKRQLLLAVGLKLLRKR
eukprot:scaffold8679_cov121-Isochrysis_galbana.AAC.4